jgi:ABC-type phosphate transport system substrate-binding protein
MSTLKRGCVAAVVALALSTAASTLAAPEFRLVAHPSVPSTALTRNEASAIFLKKTAKWSDGTPVTAVDLRLGSPTREAFSRDVHGRSASAVDAYWQKQLFSGQGLPPLTKATDDEALTFVRHNPGAITYVSGATSSEGVKTIEIR